MLHASFQLLVDYIELERPSEYFDYDLNPHLKEAYETMMELYSWWKVDRPKRLTLHDRLLGIPEPSWDEMWEEVTEGPHTGCCQMVDTSGKYPEYHAVLRGDREIVERYLDEDQRNLHRLIDVRTFMWT